MNIKLGYGDSYQCIDIPDNNILDILNANDVEHQFLGTLAVRHAIENPIGDDRLSNKINKSTNKNLKVCIITSDITRPMPSKIVLPLVLEELNLAGVSKENIKIVFALGSHRHQTKEEMISLVGEEIYNTYICEDSTPEDTVRLGITSNQTPIEISKNVAESDFIICLGNVDFHYFAGYSGGAKALFPGCASKNSIEHNHKFMLLDKARPGNIIDNPIRNDIEEVARIIKIDYILNVVLDEHKNIVYAASGNYIKAHRKCCEYIDNMYVKHLDTKADIVIVSQGGLPKDTNLYQTQKALDNASYAVRDGGIIILVGKCTDGLGNETFERYFIESKTSDDIIDKIKNKFELGGHKAAAIAKVLKYSSIYLVSSLDTNLVNKLYMTPFRNVQAAYDAAINKLGNDSKVLIMPYGGSTFPIVE